MFVIPWCTPSSFWSSTIIAVSWAPSYPYFIPTIRVISLESDVFQGRKSLLLLIVRNERTVPTVHQIYEGTNQIQRVVVAKHLLK
jgi:hypothetical protein